MKNNQEVKALFLRAIDECEGPGACKYIKLGNTGPVTERCVAGQFAHLIGIPDEALNAWDTHNPSDASIGFVVDTLNSARPLLPWIRLLEQLQSVWDRNWVASKAESPDTKRAVMRGIVDTYFLEMDE